MNYDWKIIICKYIDSGLLLEQAINKLEIVNTKSFLWIFTAWSLWTRLFILFHTNNVSDWRKYTTWVNEEIQSSTNINYKIGLIKDK